ncbi:WD40 repeat domain-containing protein [Skeletonema marinoi]|uniref:WD40 repeat domain-containing protein n=1 Tax=Skeletonema marinoi TaxID=267567 RepID=A0AAD9D875_9STRA|nr:WD40 repeat domain-containing protein [Skeletonema marinoi]|eukprot:scaffold11146_cov144-Skeletonema_marinoi.AAC.6
MRTTRSRAVSGDSDDDDAPQTFMFQGKAYESYQEMVNAKRQRNQDVLASSGLLGAKAAIDDAVLEQKAAKAASRGLKRSKAPREPLPRRKSSRLQGVAASGIYVESELAAGKVVVAGGLYTPNDSEEESKFFNDRINDGSDLTVSEAVELCGSKWSKEGTVEAAEQFMKQSLSDITKTFSSTSSRKGSPDSVRSVPGKSITSKTLQSNLNALSLESDTCVAKVTPERIYSVACHPNPNHIIACAGDKRGHVGIWNVDQYGAEAKQEDESSSDGVHLFKPFNGAVSSMTWNQSGTSLLAASYDGSVRSFDVEKQAFKEVFATYSDDDVYKDKLGYNLHGGYRSWLQSLELDHRFGSECFFLSTSEGSVMHVDLRSKRKVTFDQTLSERKINSMSLHPNGYTMATAGLSTVVQLWDIRSMSDSKSKKPKPLAWQNVGKSINSAFFSPSGKRLLTTTMMDHLDILEDAHLASGLIKTPKTRIKHDNRTGRWLSTFMARWHPASFSGEEIFVSGSMKKPRTIEVFGGNGSLLREIRGIALTAVASRCCFHPSAEKLIVIGGNSSGRLTIAR